MTAKELKNSILQLAVQGKLVSQNSNDEPASELLKRIQAEKVRLIKEGVYVIDKKHTAEPIKEDDFPHDLPNGWEWVRFADIVAFPTFFPITSPLLDTVAIFLLLLLHFFTFSPVTFN